jgi:hypothetical protein
MATRFFGDAKPWVRITKRVEETKGRVVAAIAYVAKDAPDLLPLKEGDILVCDAEDASIKAGRTSAEALWKYHKRGVTIYKHRGLHAKVVVLPRAAFVGSANASFTSRHARDEAILETTESGAVQDARDFVLAKASGSAEAFRLDKPQLQALRDIEVDRPRWEGSDKREPVDLPERVGRLLVQAMILAVPAKASTKIMEDDRREVRAGVSKLGPGLDLEAQEWWTEDAEKLKRGDWILGVYETGRVDAPVQVVEITPSTKRRSVVWVASPRSAAKSVRLLAIDNKVVQSIHDESGFKWVKGEDTVSLLAKFKKQR